MPQLCQSKNYNAKASKSRQYPRYTYSLWDLRAKSNICRNHLYNVAVGLHVVLRPSFFWTNPRFIPWEFQAYSNRMKTLFYPQLFAWFLICRSRIVLPRSCCNLCWITGPSAMGKLCRFFCADDKFCVLLNSLWTL